MQGHSSQVYQTSNFLQKHGHLHPNTIFYINLAVRQPKKNQEKPPLKCQVVLWSTFPFFSHIFVTSKMEFEGNGH